MSFLEQADLTPDQIKNEVDQKKAILIDVREQEEVEAGHLKGTFWLALSELSQSPEKFLESVKKSYGDKNLYLYCKSGGRSGQATEFFKSAGLNAINIGGFQELSQDFDHQEGDLSQNKIS